MEILNHKSHMLNILLKIAREIIYVNNNMKKIVLSMHNLISYSYYF